MYAVREFVNRVLSRYGYSVWAVADPSFNTLYHLRHQNSYRAGRGEHGICALLAFWFAGRVLRRDANDVPARMADSAAIVFTVLLSTFEIRHLVYDGDVYHQGSGLAEVALNVSSWLATTIGLERTYRSTGSPVCGRLNARIRWWPATSEVEIAGRWVVMSRISGSAFGFEGFTIGSDAPFPKIASC